MSKRKLLTVLLLAFVTTLMLACAVIFTACGNNETPDDGQNTEQGGENPGDGDEPGTNPGTDPDDDKDIAVTAISLDKTSLTLEVGGSYTLVVTVSPSNATNKSVTWSSANSSVAAVNGGKVTAKSEGTTTITAEAHNGKTAICTVIVNEPAPEVIEVTSVSLNKTSLTLEIGESETLTATVLPSNATDKSVTWTSSDQSVATVANGRVTAVGSGTTTITATTSNGKTATCTVTVNAAVPEITQVEGATMDGTDIFMFVDHTTDSVALLNKVTISSGRWGLYSDILGQNRIPTKIAAGSNGKLQNGDNVFYIMLENENGDLAAVYTLTVYRSYAETVNYYNHKNVLVHSETAYTGYEYLLNFDYSTPGYTFNAWEENGAAYQPRVLWDKLSLYADMTAIEYTVSLDANDGTVSSVEQKVTYDAAYSLPAPEREGHTFLGWYNGESQLTDEYGQSLSVWQLAKNVALTAEWKINQYNFAIEYDSNVGSVTGTEAGLYDYGTEITLTASAPNLGYAFLGWYQGDELLTEDSTYRFTLPANSVTLVAQYEVLSEMSGFTFTSTPAACTITGIKDKTVTEITVPDYVTAIEEGALSGCASLESVTLPFVGGGVSATSASGSTLFGYIFGVSRYTGDTATRQYYVSSSSVTSVTYYIPASLKNVTITGGYILYGTFSNCSGLTSVEIPDSVTSIGERAFYNCSGLTSVTIPNSVTSIGSSAFSGCSNLTSVTLPFVGGNVSATNASVSTLFGYIFGRSSYTAGTATQQYYASTSSVTYYIPASLKNVTITGGYILYGTFSDCSGLTSVEIPDSVTSIGDFAFRGCSGLTSVTIGNSVTSIGDYAFDSCSGLTSVTIGNSVTSIGNSAFGSCSGLTSVTIGNGVKNIGDKAFWGCSELTSVTIGNSVTSIGSAAFYGCSGLTSVNITDLSGWCKIFFDGLGANPLYFAGNLYLNGILVNDLVIPDSVTNIGSYAFYNCSSLTSVTIPYSVTSIGNSAFYNCSGLTSVTIPDNVTSIGSSAFEGCSGLTSVYITNLSAWCKISFSTDDSNPLYFAHNLYLNGVLVNDLVIPNDVTSIGNSAFYNCSSLTSVTIGNGVKNIGDKAFWGCSELTSVTIGNSVTSIGSAAFYNCSGLTSVTIPDNVTSIGSSAFEGCSGLTSVTIPDNVTSIGDRAFSDCTSLTKIFYNAVSVNALFRYAGKDQYGYNRYVYYEAFYNAGNNGIGITVVFGDNVQRIPSYLFYVSNSYYCPKITSVTIGNSVTSIGDSAFYNCSGLTSVEIPDSVTSIGSSAFRGCSGLTSVTIPDSVTSIGDSAFEGCSGLMSIIIPFVGENVDGSGATHFGFIFGAISYSKNYEYVPKNLKNVNINGSMAYIGSSAFRGCSGLTSVTIPESVTSIGESAFSECSNLTSITLPFIGGSASATSASRSTLFGYIFGTSSYAGGISTQQYYASSSSVTYYIPASLKSVTITGGNIQYGAFYNCGGLTSVTIPESVTSIGERAFLGCSGLTSVTIPESVTSIGDYAYYECSGLTSVPIPNSVTSIGNGVFRGCSGLTSVTIPESVTSIGEYAFSYCSGLTSVPIPESVTSIGRNAFAHCSSLTSVEIPDGVTSIGWATFYGCSELTSVTIGNSVESIENYAFTGCSGLTSVTIPESVTSIGEEAFHDCSGLASVTFKNPNGWWRSDIGTATSGTSISSSSLSNPSTAAAYLTSTYVDYYWKRS